MKPSLRALIIIDLQNDFHPFGLLPVPGSDGLVSVANKIIPLFDTVLATQLWHPADHIIFAANHPWRKPGQTIEFKNWSIELKELHCVAGSFGAEWMPGLETERIYAIFKKGTKADVPSQSAFFDKDGSSTGLPEYLSKKKIGDVYLMGVIWENEILKTALDAQNLGFEAKVILDGCKGITNEKFIEILKQKNIDYIESDNLY